MGNPKTEMELETQYKTIAQAAYKWRTKISSRDGRGTANGCEGAFSNFRVILHCSKATQFKTLVEAGGGTVLNVR